MGVDMRPVPAGRAPLVFAILGCLGAALDAAVAASAAATGATAFTVVMAGSLGASFGLCIGALTALSVRGARRLPPIARWGAFPLAGAGGGMLWADGLGAFTHIGMGHVGLGALTLVLATTAGVACGLVPALLAPTPRFPSGPGLARGVGLPVVVLAGGALALVVIERRVLPPFYPAAHDGAAVLALAAASLAVWLLVGRRAAGSGPSHGGVAERAASQGEVGLARSR